MQNYDEDLWHKLEIDYFNAVDLRAIAISTWVYSSDKHYSHIRVMCDNMISINHINKISATKSDSINKNN